MPVTSACARAPSKAPFVCFIASTRASRKKWEPPRQAAYYLSLASHLEARGFARPRKRREIAREPLVNPRAGYQEDGRAS